MSFADIVVTVMEQHPMRRIREVLRLRHELKLSHRQISASMGMSKGSVHAYLQRAEEAGLTWEAARGQDDAAIEARLFHDTAGRNEPPRRAPVARVPGGGIVVAAVGEAVQLQPVLRPVRRVCTFRRR